MESVWFNSWGSILRIVCVTPLIYGTMILLLRVYGKRTLSKMNAFDLVVTFALGSILAGVAINQKIPLADGITAMLLFIVLQYLLTWLSVRVKFVKNLITNKPSLIFYKGEFLYDVMKKERITTEEILSAVRQEGISNLDEIAMIILETTGAIAIIKKIKDLKNNTFENVEL